MKRLYSIFFLLVLTFTVSAQVSQNPLIGNIAAPEVFGSGACIVQNDQGAITGGYLGWNAEGVHATLIDPTGTGGAGDPGCAGDFTGQTFELNSVTFTLADATAFGSPNGETGIGTVNYTVSVHPLAVSGDPTMGPAAAIDSVSNVLTMDASAVYTITDTLATSVSEPFFIAITFDSFSPNHRSSFNLVG
ncbi:MAG: hypothetical protein PF630_02020 [Gammaproteobacteria bacterium]|jgi:hypothetical protein|nr:hypothetical protein [Gammaproteobacteria bacterium]